MKLRLQLPLVIASALLLMLCAALFGLLRQQQALSLYHDDVARHMAHERLTSLMLNDFKLQAQEWKNILLRGHQDQDRTRYWQAFESQEQAIQAHSQQLLDQLPAGLARQQVEQFLQAHRQMGQAYRRGMEAFIASGHDPRVGDAQVRGIDRQPAALLEQAARQIAADSAALSLQAQAMAEQARWLSLGVCLLVFAVGLAISVGYSRHITRPLAQAVDVARGIAAGDLRQPITITGRNEITDLMRALQHMQSSLSELVQQVRADAEQVATASQQIAGGNHDLSRRTESQASALQQSNASMEALAGNVRHTADNAQSALALARQASQVATDGRGSMLQLVQTMQDIEHSSQRIADITSLIHSIAFQTNILALNAAVEAARAGEQGRGFAVVASEVRALSQRTTAAAKDISTLIARSAERVTAGVQQAGATGSTMDSIEATIHRVTALVQDIAQASQAQSTGVLQMGGALSDIDNSTQHNAALVEEMAAAASSLHSQSQGLLRSASAFQTDAGTPRPAVPALQA
ncbi:HAMP domain-containing protein [Comamonas sp. CAH-2]|uniref:methyl-accepting chemotaxis protein n=1 Tax=Comamonas sp. CAH-2 TaxID=2605745 RepID=UPI0012ADE72C|nr:methyl-accepting chemotaxis protein [Comamonas sp. CAH-2]MRT20409.1 HAMP domain-containing protein [Comamonas sp. CAH-2]